jgi:hypothetical protein
MDLDLDNMREFGIRSLRVTCRKCLIEGSVNVDEYPGETRVKWFAARVICQNCGTTGDADVRPDWSEQTIRMPKP